MNKQYLLQIADFWKTRILLTAVDLEIFPLLQESVTASNIARAKDLDTGATERLLDALVALEILHKTGNDYEIIHHYKKELGDGVNSMIGMLRHRLHLWESWSMLSEIVRSGKCYYELKGSYDERGENLGDFIRAMAASGANIAEETLIALDLEAFGGVGDVDSVLDIGGGPAIYANEFCKALPGIRMVILDRPGVKEIAAEFIENSPYKDEISFIDGDALTVDDADVTGEAGDKKFDIVFASNLIHSMSPDEVRELLRRMGRWVNPGGQIVLKDFYLEDNRTHPTQAAIFDINMLTNTPEGKSYTWSEVEAWMNDLVNENGEKVVKKTNHVYLSDGFSGMIVADING